MTTTITPIDSTYSANDSTGRKRLFVTASVTNPYSTGGEAIDLTSYLKTKFLGGSVAGINPSVSAANAAVASTAQFRADSSSLTPKLQMWNTPLTATGVLVDNTIANLSGTTIYLEVVGY
jgi:hypothetical protein